MCYPFSAWTTRQAWQTCPIVLAAVVVWKKRLSTPTTASEFARFGITSGSGRLASNPSSSCCSRSSCVSGWEACSVSRNPSCDPYGDLDNAKQGIEWRCKLFSSWSDFVFSASAEGQNQIRQKALGSHNIQQKVGKCSEPGRKKGGNAGVILPSSVGPWRLRYGFLGTPSLVSRFSYPWKLVSSML